MVVGVLVLIGRNLGGGGGAGRVQGGQWQGGGVLVLVGSSLGRGGGKGGQWGWHACQKGTHA